MSILKTNTLQHLDSGSANIELAKGGGAIHSGISTFQEDIHLNDIVHLQDTDTKIRFPAADTFTVETAGSERVRVTSAGLVGIGTDEGYGDAKLTVEGTAALTNNDTTLQIKDNVNDNAAGRGGNIGFSGYLNGTQRTFAGIGGLKSNAGASDFSGDLALYTRANNQSELDERLRITSAGLVGIGTDNPATPLEVQASNLPVTIRRNSNAGDFIYFRNNNFYNVIGGDNGSLYFKTNGTAGGDERLRILSGGGITFNGDTATANALDDYEEGTITTWRLVKNDANTNGANHAQTEVYYTKIGRCVYISGHIRTDGTETSKTGNLKLVSTADGSTAATLPFVPNHRGGLPIVHTRSCSTSDTTYGLSVGFRENNSTVYVYANDSVGDYIIDSNTLDTNTQTNLVITFNGHYFTDS